MPCVNLNRHKTKNAQWEMALSSTKEGKRQNLATAHISLEPFQGLLVADSQLADILDTCEEGFFTERHRFTQSNLMGCA
jgi:hypothetical protein